MDVRVGVLMLACVSLGCEAQAPRAADDRPCFPGVLDSETAMLLRASHPEWHVRAGDLIQTPECAMQDSLDHVDLLR